MYKLKDSLVNFIKKHEGCRLKPYKDNDAFSIGYGHQIKSNEIYLMQGITQDMAETILRSDLEYYINYVNRLVTINLSDSAYEALVSLCFNIGVGAFSRSTLLAKINQSASKEEICKHFLEWNKSGGKVLDALSKRRQDELDLFYAG